MTLIDNNYTQENANVGFPGNLTGLKSVKLVEVVNIVCCNRIQGGFFLFP